MENWVEMLLVSLPTKHLYVVSDEKPEIGDYSINLNSPYDHKELCTIDNEFELERYVMSNKGSDCRKVIMSTDPLIGKTIPKEFVDQYNDTGNPIETVLVKMEREMVLTNGYKDQPDDVIGY